MHTDLRSLQKKKNVADKVAEKLLHSYFIDGEKIGDRRSSDAYCRRSGISQERVKAMLDSDEFAADVKADIAEARQIGVQGVPFFVINRKYAISGAQPAETFADALRKVAEEEGIQSN